MKKILYVVDCQYDFMPEGNLAVEDGDAIIPVINKLIREGNYDNMFFTRDYHPLNHGSFASNNDVEPFTMTDDGMKWPNHCVAGTKGAEIHSDITIPAEMGEKVNILNKGTNNMLSGNFTEV